MKQVRQGLFETNSSSTHSMTIVPKKEFEEWIDGKAVFDYWEDEIISLEKLRKNNFDSRCKYDSCEECLQENNHCCNDSKYKTYNGYYDDLYMESYERKYKTENGDEIVIFGYYGYDG